MRIKQIKHIQNAIKSINPDRVGYEIMSDKAQILAFRINSLDIRAMNILKQDALSLNAEVTTPRDAILGKNKSYDCVLFGSKKALKLLAKKLQIQPFGLREIGRDLRKFLNKEHDYSHKIMSIVNVDSNSFYKSFGVKDAIDEIYKNIELGADIIDIGAVSTRPGSSLVESSIELERLDSIFKEIRNIKTEIPFSIDTYNASVAARALDSGFSIINDISGNVESMLEILSANKHASYILTHIKGTPENMQNNCEYENLILDIDRYFEERLEILSKSGIDRVILDVGIGFGKSASQNVELLRELRHFRHFRLPLLIGASHKSFLAVISKDDSKERLEQTLIAHFFALQNGANIIRVHDLEAHKKMIRMFDEFIEPKQKVR